MLWHKIITKYFDNYELVAKFGTIFMRSKNYCPKIWYNFLSNLELIVPRIRTIFQSLSNPKAIALRFRTIIYVIQKLLCRVLCDCLSDPELIIPRFDIILYAIQTRLFLDSGRFFLQSKNDCFVKLYQILDCSDIRYNSSIPKIIIPRSIFNFKTLYILLIIITSDQSGVFYFSGRLAHNYALFIKGKYQIKIKPDFHFVLATLRSIIMALTVMRSIKFHFCIFNRSFFCTLSIFIPAFFRCSKYWDAISHEGRLEL